MASKEFITKVLELNIGGVTVEKAVDATIAVGAVLYLVKWVWGFFGLPFF